MSSLFTQKPFGIIYRAINKINGKSYVGLTKQKIDHPAQNCWELLENRKKIHKSNSKQRNYYFANAIHKYGLEAFNWLIIEEVFTNLTELNKRETYWIAYLKLNDKNFGYNLTGGGDGTVGMKWSEKTRRLRKDKGIDVCRKIRCVETNQIFSSAKEAEKFFGKAHGNLYRALVGQSYTWNKLHWEYLDEQFKIDKSNIKKSLGAGIKRSVKNLESGIIYKSVQNASEQLGLKPQKIRILAREDKEWSFVN